jgi:hypothetical protein
MGADLAFRDIVKVTIGYIAVGPDVLNVVGRCVSQINLRNQQVCLGGFLIPQTHDTCSPRFFHTLLSGWIRYPFFRC